MEDSRPHERGQVAHSAELTGSAGLLAAVAMLGFWGDDLAAALIALLRAPLLGTPVVSADPGEVVARLRQLALQVIWPMMPIVGGFVLAAIGVHQGEVAGSGCRACWRLDPSRLWTLGQGQGIVVQWAWGLVVDQGRRDRGRGRLGDPDRLAGLPAVRRHGDSRRSPGASAAGSGSWRPGSRRPPSCWA